MTRIPKQSTKKTNPIKKVKTTSSSKIKKSKNISEDAKYFELIFNNYEFGIAFFEPTGRILKVNKTISDILGYSIDELNQLTIQKISYPTDHEYTSKLLSELLEGKRTSYKVEKRYLSKSGKIIPANLTVRIAKEKNGKISELISVIEDLSEKKELLNKVESEQILLDALLKYTPDSIYFKDKRSHFIKVNAAKASKHGYPNPDELIGKSDLDLFGKEHFAKTFNDEQTIIIQNKPIIGLLEKVETLDGKIRYGSTTKMPWYDNLGNIIGTFGITRDITERVLSQEQVKASELLYRSLFTNSIDGIYLMDDVVMDCNQSICDLLQLDREEYIGRFPSDFSPKVQPDGRDSFDLFQEKIEAARQGTPQRFFWVHKRKDGKLVDAEISLSLVIINEHKFVQSVVRDITERLRNQKLKDALFEISETAYIASDIYSLYKKIHEVVGRLMPAHNFYIALHDESSDMITFPYFVDEIYPPQQPKRRSHGLTEYVLKTGNACLIDSKKDLELREAGAIELVGAPQAIWLGVPLKVSGKTTGVIVVQDYQNENAYDENDVQILTFVAAQVAQVLERKRNADEMLIITQELQHLNATKDKFFSIIAHDLRNPFITILGFSDLLITDYFELSDEERKFYLEEMRKSAELSHNLLQNLLQWSRSQTGRIEFSQSKLPIKSIVNNNFELLEGSAEKKGIKLICNVENNIILSADEDMLNTIIRNLITNAIKFTQSGGSISVDAQIKETFAEISVTDTGVGMEEKVLNNLFKIDVSHSSFGTNNEAGTGLGLILCKEFVERHKGTISAVSEPGKGSTFSFTIPLVEN